MEVKPEKAPYCPDCGKQTIIREHIKYYASDTGKPIYEYRAKCTSLWHETLYWLEGVSSYRWVGANGFPYK